MSQPLQPMTFPLYGTRLIEASAGTGKTFTIAALYVRLVLHHGGDHGFSRPLTPAEILVVTFTKAATEELRDRIRRNLAEAARIFRGEAIAHPFLSALAAEYPLSAHAGLARRLELAANSMDDAAIFTIHGWAQRMLRQHAFDSGRAFVTEIEEDLDRLWLEAARDYWRTFAYDLGAHGYSALTDALGSPQQLASLGRYYPEALQSLDGACFTQLARWEAQCRELEASARQAWCRDQPDILAWFTVAVEEGQLNKASHKDQAVRDQLQGLCAWAAGEMAFERGSHGRLASRRLKLKKGMTAPAFEALDLLSDLDEQQALPEQMESAIQAHGAGWCQQRVEIQKQRRARMTFDDMLKHMDQALQGPGGARLTQTIRQHYPIALIDEFQDTDPGQYRIFRQIYGQSQDRTLGFFMIGDPKQAIYGFRGADIYTYLTARQHSADQLYTLDTNFRSVPTLVDGINQVFDYAGGRSDGAFLLGARIPFEPVKSRGKSEQLELEGEPLAGLKIWSQPDLGISNKPDYLATLSASCASEIRRLLSAGQTGKAGFRRAESDPDANGNTWRPLQPSDIAILVRDFNEAGQIRSALAQRGLRSAYLSDRESVFASTEAGDLLSWLRAAAEPEREGLIRDALANRTVNLDLALLDIHNEDELAWEARVEQFRGYRKLWQERGVLPLVRHLLDDFAIPQTLLASAEGERSLTNLLHLSELLQSHATQLDGEQALIRFLAEQIETGGKDLGEAAVLRLESDDDLIKVVTFHKSKGLEYPLVFIPFAGLCRPLKKGSAPLVGFHDDAGDQQYGSRDDQTALARADRERLAEDLRLLYVALTRPRFACWVGLLAYGQDSKKNGYSCKLAASALGYILSAGKPLPPADLWQALNLLATQAPAVTLLRLPAADDQSLAPSTAAGRAKTALQPSRRPALPWWVSSYSGVLLGAAYSGPAPSSSSSMSEELMPAEDAGPSPAYENASELRHEPNEPTYPHMMTSPNASIHLSARDSLHGLPRGAVIGNFFHALLEWMAGQGFDRIASEPETLRNHLLQQCLHHNLEPWSEVLQSGLLAILRAPLGYPGNCPGNYVPDHPASSPGLSLGELAPAAYQAELEFLFPTHSASTQAIDQLITATILPGLRRPALRPQTLNGMLKGYIDLVFEHEGRFYVLDYKSNWLGEDQSAYTAERMNQAMLEHRYDLQYALYTLALHRLLKARLPDYDYDRDMGGAYYLFLRGLPGAGAGSGFDADSGPDQQPSQASRPGVYVDRPSKALIESLDRLFRAQAAEDGESAEVNHAD